MTKTNNINQHVFPLLSRFCATISDVELESLFSELVHFNKDIAKDMNFWYKNGREEFFLEVPLNMPNKYRGFRKYSGQKMVTKVIEPC